MNTLSEYDGPVKFAGEPLQTSMAPVAIAQSQSCAAPPSELLIICRAGSFTRAFRPIEKLFTCQTGLQVTDQAMGSVDEVAK